MGLVFMVSGKTAAQTGAGLLSPSQAKLLTQASEFAREFFELNTTQMQSESQHMAAELAAQVAAIKHALELENREVLSKLEAQVAQELKACKVAMKQSLHDAIKASFSQATAAVLLADILHSALPEFSDAQELHVRANPEQAELCFAHLKKLSGDSNSLERLAKLTRIDDETVPKDSLVIRCDEKTYLLEADKMLRQFLAKLNEAEPT